MAEEAGRAKSHQGTPADGRSPRIHDVTPSLEVRRSRESTVLAWAPPQGNETPVGYQVWRSNSPFALIATVPSDQTTFEDLGAPETSKYKVTAFFETTALGGFVESADTLAAAPDWTPGVYKTAALNVAVPSLGARLAQGLGLGSGFLLVVMGLAVGRYDLLVRGGPLGPARPDTVRLVSLRIRGGELVRFLEMWEEAGRPFRLEDPTMQVWNDYRQALVEDHASRDQTSL
ncbi:MAG: hypothetical protein HYT80_03200 [Euryarchaeota archaeon]|nr:hypothetical protein [Euryarchaeota archaeon]